MSPELVNKSPITFMNSTTKKQVIVQLSCFLWNEYDSSGPKFATSIGLANNVVNQAIYKL